MIRRVVLVASLVAALVTVSTSTARADRVVVAAPSADTFVSSSAPSTSYGSIKVLEADASPTKIALLRFDVSGIQAGAVASATLRLHVTDPSPDGGIVRLVAGPWDETVTWANRPPINPAPIASIGSVVSGSWYEIDVTSAVAGDGPVDLAIESTSSDGVRYGSRQSTTPPELVVVVVDESPPPPLPDRPVTTVAGPLEGSSSPTAYASQHRLVQTTGGRSLAVHGRHAVGVQLAWRDVGSSSWSRSTTGAATDGLVLANTKTGDWTASIALGVDGQAAGLAWVAMGGDSTTSKKPVYLRRLSDLDAPDGPTIGPLVEIVPAGMGAGLVDLVVEPSGGRLVVTWTAKVSGSSYEQRIGWVTDLDTDAPALVSAQTLAVGASGYRTGTLVARPDGVALVHRDGANRLRVAYHRTTDPLNIWTMSAPGIIVPSKTHPTAAVLPSGSVVAALTTDTTTGVVSVQRFAADGTTSPVELTIDGARDPSLVASGADLRLVTVRGSGATVVGRGWTAGHWDTADEELLGAADGGGYAWPNAVHMDAGHVRFVVQGPAGAANQRAVLAVDWRS